MERAVLAFVVLDHSDRSLADLRGKWGGALRHGLHLTRSGASGKPGAVHNPLNLGLWGDLTQGALWRLTNGQWDPRLHPKVVVILIGTNNANWHSRPEDTALGIAELIRFVRNRSPTSKVLLLGILPRGADSSAPERSVNAEVNRLIQRCADGQTVVYAEPGRAMASADGRISNQVLFDFLHPTMIGYGILGGAIQAQVRKMMDEKEAW